MISINNLLLSMDKNEKSENSNDNILELGVVVEEDGNHSNVRDHSLGSADDLSSGHVVLAFSV